MTRPPYRGWASSGSTGGARRCTVWPLKSLKAYRWVSVRAGQSAEAVITLGSESFELFDPATNTVRAKAGSYEVYYGNSSAGRDLKKVSISLLED